MAQLKKMQLPAQMAIAMIAGSILGIAVGPPIQKIQFIGDIWLNLMKMVIVPMVIFVVVKGISTMDSPKTLGRIGLKTFIFYTCLVILATVVGAMVTLALQPGIGFHFAKASKAMDVVKVSSFSDYMVSLFSSNMFSSFASGNTMQVLIIAILLGIAVVYLREPRRAAVKAWFDSMADLFMSVVNLVMKFSPVGVFCIMAAALAERGLGTFISMGKLLAAFYLSCLIQVLVIYLALLWIVTKISPLEFVKKSSSTWVAAISMCSSAAVIPVNLNVCDKEFNVSDNVSSFSIPFGVQFNQEGGSILSAVVILFSAQAIGAHFGFLELVRVILVCTLVAGCSGAIPGGGIVRLMVSSAAFGMPLEIVVLIAAFYRLFDMGTTSMCCVGNLSATLMLDRLEKRRAERQKELGAAAAI
jgi:Na+/H+-dicarboxylate symporter